MQAIEKEEGRPPLLIYDAKCRLCVSSKRWIEWWDTKHRIRFIPFQSEEARQLVPDIAPLGCFSAMRLIDQHGVVSSGVSAFRGTLPFLPMGGLFTLFFQLPGALSLAELFYQMVARNRYRWFGATRKA
jgi:predicted DCC family thiol-disulfide oxidoreductase YuxK